MKKGRIKALLLSVFLGDRYFEITDVKEQVRYMTINWIFIAGFIPLVILGVMSIETNLLQAVLDFIIAFLCLTSVILLRTKFPRELIPVLPVIAYGAFCCYLLYIGDLNLWAAVWIFSYPPIAIFLCRMTVGVTVSASVMIVSVLLMFTDFSPIVVDNDTRIRIIGAYILITSLSIIYERISVLKDRKENELKAELAQERDMIQTMKDNINQGIFLLDKDLNILPQYSQPLISILSYYESDLAGKNLLDILNTSLDSRQLHVMKSYFKMVFTKEKTARVLEAANPISEFEYKTDDEVKYLSTRFQLIEQAASNPVVIGIIQDITKEKEIELELQSQKEIQEIEMKNMFDVIKIDPLVFQNFIEDTESNFNSINTLLKDRFLSEKEVVTKIFQYIHAIKSNAIILDLENLANKLHSLEDDIKVLSNKERIFTNDMIALALKIESFMQEMDSYIAITKKIGDYKTSNQMDRILVNSLSKAAERLADELNKKVKLKAGEIDLSILESKLRKPIKDILFQCVRNSIYHGIELPEERIAKKKDACGLLSFSIKNVDGKAVLIFSDDGAGLNWKRIQKKYLEKHPAAKADKKILLGSIFSPEFSTADETSSAAGRGVGLSLVKDLVKENHGSVNVNSTETGLMFKFTFPM